MRKILTTPQGWRMFRAVFDLERPELFEFIDAAFTQNNAGDERLLYFNLPAFKKAGMAIPKHLADVAYTISCDVPEVVRHGIPVSFDLLLTNDGPVPLMPIPPNLPKRGEPVVLIGLAPDEGKEKGRGDRIELVLRSGDLGGQCCGARS